MHAESRQLHIAFFPIMSLGHTIPMLDTIRLFASRNVKTTLITTPLNAPNLSKSLFGTNTTIETIPFPSKEAGIPEGIENMELVTSPQMAIKFIKSYEFFQWPLEKLLEKIRPNCLIADVFFPFATDVAAKFGIPRLIFDGTSIFAYCASLVLMEDKPYLSVSSNDEYFTIPKLPHEIKLIKSQLSPSIRENEQTEMTKSIVAAFESDRKSYGVVFNSFYELEPDYADFYRKVIGRRAWHIGPVSLCNRDLERKSQRGKKASIDENECLKWLDTKEHDSVVYICFGSVSRFSRSQLHEIATALEATGVQFIWVVKKGKDEEGQHEEWLPRGFEERMEGKGLIIRGWAPQVLILEHEAIGGFVTHCGWNSTLEAISAGVPMVTWPLFADQFLNEKLVTEILKIGVPIGANKWSMAVEGIAVKHGEIETALQQVMLGGVAFEMRSKAKKLKEMARKAVEKGGSSHSDLSALIQELSSYDARACDMAV